MKTLSTVIAAAALAVSGAALAGKSQPSNISGDSGVAGSSSLSTAVATFAATPDIAASINSAPGAVQTVIDGQNATTLDFTEAGEQYRIVMIDGTVSVYRI